MSINPAPKIYRESITNLGEALNIIKRKMCLLGRKHHSWRERQTRGKPHKGSKCRWCGKLWEEVYK